MGLVASPAGRGQLNRTVPNRARLVGFARQVRLSRPASASSFSTLRLNLVLTNDRQPLSDQSRVYRVA